MTEEMKTCDFYNKKICTLFSKYFDFNVECENLFLSTIDCDIERECPIKHLEQENKKLKSNVLKWQKAFSRQYQINENKGYSKAEENYRSALEEIREIVTSAFARQRPYKEDFTEIETIINEVLK